MKTVRLTMLDFREPAARWGIMFLFSAVVGVLAGLAAAGLDYGLREGTRLLIGRFTHIGGAQVFAFRWGILLMPAVGALVSSLFVLLLCRKDSGHYGTDQVIAAFHQHGGHLSLWAPVVKALAAIGVISCGGSAGPEGPIAVLGAGIGSKFARLLSLAPRSRRILLIAGCGGGVGAIFQCPLGGALFAVSVLYREPEFEAECIVPAFVSSVLSYSTFMYFPGFGHHLLQGVNSLGFASPAELLAYAVLGLICGLLAGFFYICLRMVESRRLLSARLSAWLLPTVGGLLVGLTACVLPQIMDSRYQVLQNTLDGKIFLGDSVAGRSAWEWVAFFGFLAMLKCLATALTVGSGSAGGLLGPSVFIGGAAGAFLGALLEACWPGHFPPGSPLRQALVPVGMAGVLSASMRIPLAATVMVTEMTGSYGLIVPLMVTCVTSYVLGRRWGLNPSQVRWSAESPAHAGDLLGRMLESLQVQHLMDRHWRYTVTPSTTLGEMIRQIGSGSRPVFAVREDGRFVGVISVQDISRAISEPGISEIVIAADIMSGHDTTVTPEQSIAEVLEVFQKTDLDVLPVISDDSERRHLGMLNRRAIHEAVRSRLERIREHARREHAGIAAIEQDEQLFQLMLGVSGSRPDVFTRMPVPNEIVGVSIRQAAFQRRYGAQVVAIQNQDGSLQCPPDIDAPLREDQILVVIVSDVRQAEHGTVAGPEMSSHL
ncbi:MAG TPA: chloride channel protein [Phycisphaerae bacterium]|nr:chloride channel protein [Phycisphaerae bacterium]HRR83431.1 chloride channel protein [Phycisphaerae bacterium]